MHAEEHDSDPASERFRRVEALFLSALEQPATQRSAWLQTIEPDATVRAEALRLLDADTDADGVIERVLEAAADEWATQHHAETANDADGESLDGWRLQRKIGEGGMGAVYLAHAVSGRGAPVAIKLLREGIESALLVDRFESERRILATLSHPGIARLLDAGRSRNGRPFLVLEYVEGVPIDAYCDAQRLGVRERVALMAQVCDAVQNAHRNLVVHRDLKPGNVLVAPNGEAKLLDFGIAKLLDGEGDARVGSAHGTVTRLGWMTPAYASPEQVSGEPVRPASDVYSLGVLLYRLLTGVSPYADAESHPSALAHAIVETAPPNASMQWRSAGDGDAASGRADNRDATPQALARSLVGDLDLILAKAMAKEPDRRYGAAGELGADLNRWLQGLPIAARPATLRYRAGKFLRRHRFASALAGLLVVSIAAFLATTLVLLAQARAERDRATQMTALLTDLFEIAEPNPQRGNSITARALLDRGAERAALRLQAQPQSHAEFLATLARLYQRLGIYDSAGASLREALSLQKARFGPGSIEVADLTDHLARVMAADGKFQEAEPLFREALALRRTLLPANDERISNGINNLALVNHDLGRYAQAERLYRDVVGDESSLARDTDGTTLGNLALLYADLGRFEESERAYRRVVAVRTSLYGADDVETANAYDELGMVLLARGTHAEGKAQISRALAIYRRAFGDDHRDTARSLAHVAAAERMNGDLATAERLQRQALSTRIALLGEDHAEVAESRLELGLVLLDRNALDEASRELQRASAQYAAAVGESHPLRGRPLHALARWAVVSGDCAKAADYTVQAMALLPARDPRRAELREIQQRCGTGVPQR